MMTVSWSSLEADLTSALPQLYERYRAQKAWWEGDPIPQHVLIGDVYLPLLLEAARKGHAAETAQMCRFLEKLAESTDVRLQEVVSVTVLEFLGGDPDVLGLLRPHFGPETVRLLEERERWRRSHS